MKIAKATERYETWLARHLTIVEKDLRFKHEQMRTNPFPFLRATYYRWAQIWRDVCPEAAAAPSVLAVGDLHVENFGTWRDKEGRLIWGINDFDEAWNMPYTNDLLRLAASALLAQMTCDVKEGIAVILKGYLEALEAGGRPFALAEHHASLRHMATARLHEPEQYWEKLHALEEVAEEPPAGALKAIANMMPESGLHWRVSHRVAGLGSLGRQRYVAIAEWHGGSVAREAKALAPSACVWAEEGKGTAPIRYQEIIDCAVRCPDPYVRLQKRWIVRRLAPDCSRIELSALPKERDEIHLLQAMGWETANVHLGSAKARVLHNDLTKRPRGWLLSAARKMEKAVLADFEDYSTR
ncbi:conserved hypothetical protein [Candidatus Sulfopaludibacter sp. SbA3]|nr:conserved hypothetical protein [Candidatus Sulfopaludibacter sp. SbA3]